MGRMLRRAMFELELPFLLRLPDGEYSCRKGGDHFNIKLTRVGPPPSTAQQVTSGVRFMPNTGEIVPEDPNVSAPGMRPRHTRIAIAFGFGVADDKAEWLPYAQQKAHEAINSFLDCYRFFFQDLTVYPLIPSEFFKLRDRLGVRYKSQVETNAPVRALEMGVTLGGFPLEIGAEPPISPEDKGRFEQFVRTNAEVPLVDSLLLNAQTFAQNGELRLAVVDAGTALDVAVENTGLKLLVSQGIDPAAAAGRLERLSTREIVTTVVQRHSSKDVVGSPEWIVYDSKLRPLRNSVVHDGLIPPRPAADEFITTVAALLKLLP
ncbi:MAG: hypothetical protein ACHP7P_03155 [Terriglobales bacterium]